MFHFMFTEKEKEKRERCPFKLSIVCFYKPNFDPNCKYLHIWLFIFYVLFILYLTFDA